MSADRQASFPILALLVFAGGFLGTAAGTALFRANLETAGGSRVHDGEGELRTAITQLTRAIDELRGQKASSAAPSIPSSRENVAGTPMNDTGLAAAMDRLTAALQARGGSPAQALDVTSYQQSKTLPNERIQQFSEEFRLAKEPNRLRDEHLFMTYSQVLERYGRPSSVIVNANCLDWIYNVETPNGWKSAFKIAFLDGLVIYFQSYN